jgi:Alpha galactosidase A/Alpha galactosidase C-terminal beta sandwich domain
MAGQGFHRVRLLTLVVAGALVAGIGALPPTTGLAGATSTTVGNPSPTPASPPSYNGLALTPPMGYNDWYQYGCNVTEDEIVAQARALVFIGLAKLGYDYVSLDDCWMAPQRDANGNLQGDPIRFPHGIPWLANLVHGLGLKFGIYEAAGTGTCNGLPGSYGYYQQDAQTFASWGVDFLKFDFCQGLPGGGIPDQLELAKQMSQALLATGRPIVFSQSAFAGSSSPSVVATAATLSNLWRTSTDLNWSAFSSIVNNLNDDIPLSPYAHPGAWNDLDMLLTGNSNSTWSATAQQSQISVWSEMASPLLISNDLTHASLAALRMLSNKALIDVDQDPLGVQGSLVAQDGSVDIINKRLANGDSALLFINTSSTNSGSGSVNGAQLGLRTNPRYEVTDLWSGQTSETTTIVASLPPEGSAMYRVSVHTTTQLAPSTEVSVQQAASADGSLVSATFLNKGLNPVHNVQLAITTTPASFTAQLASGTPSASLVRSKGTLTATWKLVPTAGTNYLPSQVVVTATETDRWANVSQQQQGSGVINWNPCHMACQSFSAVQGQNGFSYQYGPPVVSCNTACQGFSGVQGQNGWRYQKQVNGVWTDFDPSTFNSNFCILNDCGVWLDFNGDLNQFWFLSAHLMIPAPSGDVSRTWTAPKAGVVDISSLASLFQGGKGVDVTITKNDQLIFGPAAVTDNIGIAANVSNLTVATGDVIRFIVHLVDPTDPIYSRIAQWDQNIVYPADVPPPPFVAWTNLANYHTDNWAGEPTYWHDDGQGWVSPRHVQPGASNDTSRTWTAPKAGVIDISGQAAMDPTYGLGGNGVILTITKNGQPIVGPQLLGGNDSTGIDMVLANVGVEAGDVIRFEVDAKGDNTNDVVIWDPTIIYQ